MTSEKKEVCPHCGADLRSSQIPEEYLAKGYYGEWKPGDPPRYYYRTIGVEIPGVYDGVLFWTCPDCCGWWHRFPVGSRLYEKAKQYAEEGSKGRD